MCVYTTACALKCGHIVIKPYRYRTTGVISSHALTETAAVPKTICVVSLSKSEIDINPNIVYLANRISSKQTHFILIFALTMIKIKRM